MKGAHRNVLLVIDHCPVHPVVPGLSNMQVLFLPPSRTSKAQPCDQGIIQALKRRYRFHLLSKFLDCIEKQEDFKPHVLDAMLLATRAWGEITLATIQNCFHHCGLKIQLDEDTQDDLEGISSQLQEILS